MQINIISAYESADGNVIAITVGEAYKYPYRLGKEKREKLLSQVLTVRQIDVTRWEKI